MRVRTPSTHFAYRRRTTSRPAGDQLGAARCRCTCPGPGSMSSVSATLRPRAAGAAPGSPAASFRPDIQGLRAVAVVAVVAYHAGVPFLRGGFVGVDVFFVLSG